jgi:hypothetical protein
MYIATPATDNEIIPMIFVILFEMIPDTFKKDKIVLSKITIDAKINSIDWSVVIPWISNKRPTKLKIVGTEYFLISKAIFSITFIVFFDNYKSTIFNFIDV